MGAAKSVAECSRGDVVNVLGFGNANKSTERELILLGWDARLLRSYTQFLVECQPHDCDTSQAGLIVSPRSEREESFVFVVVFFAGFLVFKDDETH